MIITVMLARDFSVLLDHCTEWTMRLARLSSEYETPPR